MKKIILFVSLFICGHLALAQPGDQRTIETKIADLLMKVPAQDSTHLLEVIQDMSKLGEAGIVQLAGRLIPQASGSSAPIQYAINSYSMYLSKGDKEAEAAVAVQAYSAALGKETAVENKAFLIRQLQLVGGENAVGTLNPYLNQEDLAGPAARALAAIGSESANAALTSALESTQNAGIATDLTEALGYTGYTAALPAIRAKIESSADPALTKTGLFALAQIADPASADFLKEAAEAQDYGYDPSDATSAYLRYISNLAEKGEANLAAKLAKRFSKAVKNNEDPSTRASALVLMTKLQDGNHRKAIRKALKDSDPSYRATALSIAAKDMKPAVLAEILKRVKKGDASTQQGLIAFLGNQGTEAAFPAILSVLQKDNSDPGLSLTAIRALAQTGQGKALPALFQVLKKGDKEETKAVVEALKIIKDPKMGEQIASVLPDVEAPAKVALLDVLAYRSMSGQFDDVLPLLKSSDPNVRTAAFSAIQTVSSDKHLPKLFGLLNQSVQDAEVRSLQQGIVYALSQQPAEERAQTVLSQLQKAPAGKRPLYYTLLASVGGAEALQTVSKAYQEGSSAEQAAAASALAAWSDASAMPTLYAIASQTSNKQQLDETLKAFVRLISENAIPEDQKVILLKDAMAVAESKDQRSLILKEISKLKTIPALMFAGQFLDQSDVQQAAASAIIEIALTDVNYFYGVEVEKLLNKTLKVLKGRDSEYLREAIRKHLAEMPADEGFVAVFNGRDLSGWKGLVADPIKRAAMSDKELAAKQEKADEAMRSSWIVEEGDLIFTGKGDNITTVKKYGDVEMFVDWKIFDDGQKNGDAGIYLRGTPQVQIWDNARVKVGAQVGSGGLYNNQTHESKPLKVADNPLGRWNNFHIIMKGDRVTVFLNGELVTDSVILENYWDRDLPLFAKEQIELQAHGSKIAYRDIYIRELGQAEPFELSAEEKADGFTVLFDGTNLAQWTGNTEAYKIEGGDLVVQPTKGSGGNFYTKEEYSDFNFRFDFKLTPGANNGLGIRAPLEGDAAYQGIELQILDNTADIYQSLKPYQYHGSAYGIEASKKGYLNPVGEWNHQEVIVQGPKIKVILNGTVILDADITDARKNGAADGKDHPGLMNEEGHIGFLGHGSEVHFKNIRIKDLSK